MIPILYDKTGKIKLGELVDIIDNGYVEEERNGIFEFTIDYPVGYPLSDLIVEENMIETKPNEEQGLQKFRIYDTKRLMKNVISVFARHESFDLANDHVENVKLENASCEYALNTLFRNSHFSTHYRGFSDIINAQNYKIDNVNILNAIAGKEGSIIDTYGTGAEILRDGTNIHVLNKRGHDNEVTIEFGKNLTDFVLERDLTDLETRVGGFAKYTPEGGKETIVKSNWIDSPYIENFAHPYINIEGRRDYSDKFKEGEIPTVEKLDKLCADEFKINKRDIPKSNYTIKFIPLSKCVGYEGIQDKISLCDTVRIIDKRFNVDTKAKVIKYKYDFIKERYESMELGEPRTTLGDIIGGSSGEQGPPGKDGEQGPPGQDGNVENMPDTLPNTPVLTPKVYGMGSVELSWTFENKLYYTYELYASRTKDFTPNVFDLIHAGQSSSFKFNGNPGENWYFKVCAINSHNNRTPFSNQVEVVLAKVEDMNNYFSEMAIGKAVVQSLSADYMEAGIIKAHWIELKGASVIDGNGKRTFDIDSFGRMTLMPSVFKMMIDGKEEDVVTQSKFEANNKEFNFKFDRIGSYNHVFNGDPTPFNHVGWYLNNAEFYLHDPLRLGIVPVGTSIGSVSSEVIDTNRYKDFSFKCNTLSEVNTNGYTILVNGYLSSTDSDANWQLQLYRSEDGLGSIDTIKQSFEVPQHIKCIRIIISHNGIKDLGVAGNRVLWFSKVQLFGGQHNYPQFSQCPNELYNASTHITPEGLTVKDGKIKIENQNKEEVFWVDQNGKLSTDNIHIYGQEKTANLEISGTKNKGIGLRSYDGGDRYIDFSSVPVEDGFEASINSGYHTRLIASGGEFSILPTNTLAIGSVIPNKKLDNVFIRSKEMYTEGNLSCEGNLKTSNTMYCREMGHTLGNTSPITCHSPFIVNSNVDVTGTLNTGTLRTSNIAHQNGNQGYVIVVHSTLQLNGGVINPSGVTYTAPRFYSLAAFNNDLTVDKSNDITLDNVIDNLEFSESDLPNTSNSVINVDVTKILGTNFVDSSGECVGINSTEFLKLALYEIKKLKNEVSILKEKVGV